MPTTLLLSLVIPITLIMYIIFIYNNLVSLYPDLKANITMQQLMEELSTTENRISFAHQSFNDAVMAYNTYKEQFPNSIISNVCGFNHGEHFEIDNVEAKQPVKVKF